MRYRFVASAKLQQHMCQIATRVCATLIDAQRFAEVRERLIGFTGRRQTDA